MTGALFIFILILNILNNTSIFPILNSNHVYGLFVLTTADSENVPGNFLPKK